MATAVVRSCLKSLFHLSKKDWAQLEPVPVVLSPSWTDEINFFSSVSKLSRNENEDRTVEQLELDQKETQDEKDQQEVEKEKQVGYDYIAKIQSWVEAVVSLAGL